MVAYLDDKTERVRAEREWGVVGGEGAGGLTMILRVGICFCVFPGAGGWVGENPLYTL